jgi:hypothetical protein
MSEHELVEYTLPFNHRHAGVDYKAGDIIYLRPDQIAFLEANVQQPTADAETGGNEE